MTEQRLPDLKIGDLIINPPIIQGGMGVRVSTETLAGAVSNQGALGVIASVGLGEEDAVALNYIKRSSSALREMIQDTRKITSNPFGVNIMYALTNFDKLVKVCDEEEIDAIFSGAGLPLHLPALITNNKTKLIPIISSARAAKIICNTWQRRYKRLPDAVVLEGPLAGGHLGFSNEELKNPDSVSIDKLIPEVLKILETYKSDKEIPLIVAGGIFDGKDIAKCLKLGAKGVQMATRFICTQECNVSEEYKNTIINAKKDDTIIISSPAKMPARVIKNEFVMRMLNGEKIQFDCNYQCLKTCNPSTSQYCIAQALVNAYRGNMDKGFAMCGTNAYKIDKVVSVKDLLTELTEQALKELIN